MTAENDDIIAAQDYTRDISIDAIQVAASTIKFGAARMFLKIILASFFTIIFGSVVVSGGGQYATAAFFLAVAGVFAFLVGTGGYVGARYSYRSISKVRAMLIEDRRHGLPYKPRVVPWSEL